MARVLIVGCGCRGRELARALAAGGHAVRGTTRDPARAAAIAEAGAEPYVGDPDRIGTLMGALTGVSVVCWLLGTVPVRELHGPRLRMLFEKLVDTPVRGVVYEAALPEGIAIARDAAERWRMRVETIEPGGDARAAVRGLLGL